MVRALKVYRTAIGFHDAYVAAPSQKAALEAWGSDKDLFARGAAELVTDPALAADALASPGQVIRRLRGTVVEQLAALPPAPPPAPPRAAPAAAPTPVEPPPPPRARRPRPAPPPPEPPRPRPDRAAVDAAEAAVVAAERAHADQRRDLAHREADLARERRTLAAAQAAELERLQRASARAEEDYHHALDAWQR